MGAVEGRSERQAGHSRRRGVGMRMGAGWSSGGVAELGGELRHDVEQAVGEGDAVVVRVVGGVVGNAAGYVHDAAFAVDVEGDEGECFAGLFVVEFADVGKSAVEGAQLVVGFLAFGVRVAFVVLAGVFGEDEEVGAFGECVDALFKGFHYLS